MIHQAAANLPSQPPLGEDRLGDLPARYRLRAEGGERVLVCIEAPTLKVRVERSASVTAAQLRSAPAGSIFLDGAAASPPQLALEAGVINLDHHEGCVRAFTLATCEQAYLLVAKGIDFQSREYTLYANEPDLDTLLALWVLLNHRRLERASPRLLERLVPLLRLEGIIDTHGLTLRHFAGLPAELERETFGQHERLRAAEADLRRDSRWLTVDALAYTLDRLCAIDRLLYVAEDFAGDSQVEELGRTELPEQRLAIGCRATTGIYEVEQHLRAVYERRLGVVVLQQGSRHYTVRQVTPFGSGGLERLYDRLNLIDPRAGNSRSPHRWGGSSDIGGSPRGPGSGLSVAQVLDGCAGAFAPLRSVRLFWSLALATMAAGATSALSMLPLLALGNDPAGPALDRAQALSGALLLLGAITLIGALWLGPGALGLRRPIHAYSLLYLPVVLIAGTLGGLSTFGGGNPAWIVLSVLGAELLHRGLVYGSFQLLLLGHRRPPFTSPLLCSTLIYALCTTATALARGLPPLLPARPASLIAVFAGASLAGATLAWARQRSESLVVPFAMHLIAALLVAVLR